VVVCENSLIILKILERKFKSGYLNPKKPDEIPMRTACMSLEIRLIEGRVGLNVQEDDN
jgi:hypothetical protein